MGIVFFLLLILIILLGIAGIPIFLLKRKPKMALVSLLVVAAGFFIFPEQKFNMYPLIDTSHAQEFSVEAFSKVQSGMTREQVYVRIGKPVIPGAERVPKEPGTKGWLNPTEFGYCEQHTNDGKLKYWDFAWYHANVCYTEQGEVYSSYGEWQMD